MSSFGARNLNILARRKTPMSIALSSHNQIIVRQKKELAELVGFETRNKYSIELTDGQQIAFAGEDGKSWGSFFGRQFLGHWRPFQIKISNHERKPFLTIIHPFNF